MWQQEACVGSGSDKEMHNSLVVLELYMHVTLLVVGFHQTCLFFAFEPGPQ